MKKTLLVMTLLGIMVILSTAASAKENFVVVVKDFTPAREYDIRQNIPERDHGTFKTAEKGNPKPANMLLGIRGVQTVTLDKNEIMITYGDAFTDKEMDKEVFWVIKCHFNIKKLRYIEYTAHDAVDQEAFQKKLDAVIHKS